MSFWSGLGKILGVAGSVAAIPFTGGASAAALPAVLAPTLGAGSAIASALGGAAKKATTIRDAMQGGSPADLATRYGNMADQAAINRMAESKIAQAGPTADAQALANVMQSGKWANYTPPPAATQALWDKFGKRMPAPDATTSAFARDMQAELSRRLAAGEPLTLSGVGKASAQETADAAKARQMALQGPNGGGLTGALNTGAAIAGAIGPTFDDILKKFKKPITDPSYNATQGYE